MKLEIKRTRKYKIIGRVCNSCLERIRNERMYIASITNNKGKEVYSEVYCEFCAGESELELVRRINRDKLPLIENYEEFKKFKNTKAYKQNIKRKN